MVEVAGSFKYMLGRTQVGDALILFPYGDLWMKDAMSWAFSHERPDSETRVLVGDVGQEEIGNARGMVEEEADNDGLGGGVGRGINVTLICGSFGTEVAIVW